MMQLPARRRWTVLLHSCMHWQVGFGSCSADIPRRAGISWH
jgi:hypothetical protein